MQDKKQTGLPDLSAEQRGMLASLYEIYYDQMYKKAYDILRNTQDAEDAVQEAFYRVCCNAEVFVSPDSDATAALIYTYTRNVAINHYRRKKRQNLLISGEGHPDSLALPDEYDLALQIEKEQDAAMLRRAVDALDGIYREVILLKYYEHMTNTQIAEMLGLDRGKVNSRIFRAKKMLRALLERHNFN
ncbi:MAG: RNA polymerase sigma factor [Clostridia bacterium]|nr:RNA polymerase sigma factor [Clostridia bacterium]